MINHPIQFDLINDFHKQPIDASPEVWRSQITYLTLLKDQNNDQDKENTTDVKAELGFNLKEDDNSDSEESLASFVNNPLERARSENKNKKLKNLKQSFKANEDQKLSGFED